MIQFSETFSFGDYIAQVSENFVLNSSGEIYHLKSVKNKTNLGHRLKPSKIKTLVKGKVFYIHPFDSQLILLTQDEFISQSIVFGQVVKKDEQFRKITNLPS